MFLLVFPPCNVALYFFITLKLFIHGSCNDCTLDFVIPVAIFGFYTIFLFCCCWYYELFSPQISDDFLAFTPRSKVTGSQSVTASICTKIIGYKKVLVYSDFEKSMFLNTQFWKILMSPKTISPCMYLHIFVGRSLMCICVCELVRAFLSCGNSLSCCLLERFYQFKWLSAVY